ncbi:uncharacterized protein MONOS_12733 [Monocercomonoides exilis]|uniref:uncharacterized protein n=1 Tax=Monocercomonoides exilis TaxID=2049356 RepID=UPI00355AAE95|nr:hypothetical protein MONOS_12733 [Monocercomonoides exilis]|eukprot:MONOS_12733.1-p1 / transcript=MONOS_12733.1 / gene=MONOS_12733 / organism=Monocercomonoides_exilis_PA203 / gene_product=unspecified product / transcript_product=unspecified product / location=Mono_scaffold00726:14019-17814(-) / protein_length=1076 / sequence_SO=supercontig / SO=protein_coding / is_pseudo=false
MCWNSGPTCCCKCFSKFIFEVVNLIILACTILGTIVSVKLPDMVNNMDNGNIEFSTQFLSTAKALTNIKDVFSHTALKMTAINETVYNNSLSGTLAEWVALLSQQRDNIIELLGHNNSAALDTSTHPFADGLESDIEELEKVYYSTRNLPDQMPLTGPCTGFDPTNNASMLNVTTNQKLLSPVESDFWRGKVFTDWITDVEEQVKKLCNNVRLMGTKIMDQNTALSDLFELRNTITQKIASAKDQIDTTYTAINATAENVISKASLINDALRHIQLLTLMDIPENDPSLPSSSSSSSSSSFSLALNSSPSLESSLSFQTPHPNVVGFGVRKKFTSMLKMKVDCSDSSLSDCSILKDLLANSSFAENETLCLVHAQFDSHIDDSVADTTSANAPSSFRIQPRLTAANAASRPIFMHEVFSMQTEAASFLGNIGTFKSNVANSLSSITDMIDSLNDVIQVVSPLEESVMNSSTAISDDCNTVVNQWQQLYDNVESQPISSFFSSLYKKHVTPHNQLITILIYVIMATFLLLMIFSAVEVFDVLCCASKTCLCVEIGGEFVVILIGGAIWLALSAVAAFGQDMAKWTYVIPDEAKSAASQSLGSTMAPASIGESSLKRFLFQFINHVGTPCSVMNRASLEAFNSTEKWLITNVGSKGNALEFLTTGKGGDYIESIATFAVDNNTTARNDGFNLNENTVNHTLLNQMPFSLHSPCSSTPQVDSALMTDRSKHFTRFSTLSYSSTLYENSLNFSESISSSQFVNQLSSLSWPSQPISSRYSFSRAKWNEILPLYFSPSAPTKTDVPIAEELASFFEYLRGEAKRINGSQESNPLMQSTQFTANAMGLGEKLQMEADEDVKSILKVIDSVEKEASEALQLNTLSEMLFTGVDVWMQRNTKYFTYFMLITLVLFVAMYPQLFCLMMGRTYWVYDKQKGKGRQVHPDDDDDDSDEDDDERSDRSSKKKKKKKKKRKKHERKNSRDDDDDDFENEYDSDSDFDRTCETNFQSGKRRNYDEMIDFNTLSLYGNGSATMSAGMVPEIGAGMNVGMGFGAMGAGTSFQPQNVQGLLAQQQYGDALYF